NRTRLIRKPADFRPQGNRKEMATIANLLEHIQRFRSIARVVTKPRIPMVSELASAVVRLEGVPAVMSANALATSPAFTVGEMLKSIRLPAFVTALTTPPHVFKPHPAIPSSLPVPYHTESVRFANSFAEIFKADEDDDQDSEYEVKWLKVGDRANDPLRAEVKSLNILGYAYRGRFRAEVGIRVPISQRPEDIADGVT